MVNNLQVNQSQVMGQMGAMNRADTKAIIRSFYDEMSDMMEAVVDPNKPLSTRGVTITDEEEILGTKGQLLIGYVMNENNNIISSIMSYEEFITKLYSDGGKLMSSGGL